MNKIKRIISLLLCSILISSNIVLATELNNSGNNGQGNTGGTNISPGGNSGSSHSYGTAWNDFEQGFRVYVVDMNAKLVPGTQVVDYWFKDPSTLKDNTYANGGSKSACTLRVGQDNSHIPYSRTTTQDLQLNYDWPINKANASDNLPTLSTHSTVSGSQALHANGKVGYEKYWKYVLNGYNITTNNITQKDVTGSQWYVYTHYPDLYDTFYESGYSLVIEHIFAYDIGASNKKYKGKKFYGSVYEWGLFMQENGTDVASGNAQYLLRFIPISITLQNYTNNDPYGIKDITHMTPPPQNTINTVASGGKLFVSHFLNEAYGTAVFHNQFKISPDVTPEPTKQENVVQNTDTSGGIFTGDLEFYYGNMGITDYGQYDIGVAAGIPTTEYFANKVYVQDRLIEYSVRDDSLQKEVTVEYITRHKYTETVPAECPSPDKKGNCPHGGHTKQVVKTSGPKKTYVKVTRQVMYHYVEDYDVYALENVSMTNGAGSATYTSNLTDLTESDITFNCSGELNPGQIDGVKQDYHIDFSPVQTPEPFEYTFDSETEENEWLANSKLQWAEDNVGYPIVKNDGIVIAGKVYMSESPVSKNESQLVSQNDTSIVTMTTPESFEDPTNDYKIFDSTDTDNHVDDIYIDPEVLNGQYYSTLTMNYERLAGTADTHPYYLTYTFNSTGATSDTSDHIIYDGIVGANSLTPVQMNGTITFSNGTSTTYKNEEPIRVITPVISPTTIRYDEDMKDGSDVLEKVATSLKNDPTATKEEKLIHGTQLLQEADTQQLRLDETYVITFDPFEHFIYGNTGYSGLLGYASSLENNNESVWFNDKDGDGKNDYQVGSFISNSKYDKYVKEKRIKFPFDVYIDDILFSANTWITLYTYDAATNTATAGDVTTNHLYETKFYIPSWAQESQVTKQTDTNGNVIGYLSPDKIEIEVIALNAGKKNAANEYESKHGSEPGFNKSDGIGSDSYIADYSINVQVSGWAYDFKVLGASPSESFNGVEAGSTGNLSDLLASLADIKDEFFTGKYNRTGHDSIFNKNDVNDAMHRYLLDGTVEEVDSYRDLIPLSSGISEFDQTSGNLKRGSDFTFSISTMSNLNENDKIVITPTFRYVTRDYQTETVTDKNGNTTVKVISGDILEPDEFQIYYAGTDETKASYMNMAEPDDDKRSSKYSDLWMRLNYKELDGALKEDSILYMVVKRNLQRMDQILDTKAVDLGSLKQFTLKGSELMLYDADALEELKINQGRNSDNLVNILGSNYQGGNVNLSDYKNKLTESVQTWYGRYYIPRQLYIIKKSDLEANGVSNLWEYAKLKGSFREDDEIFAKEGWLIVNFDITVYKDGEPYLSFSSGTSNQWARQGQRTTAHLLTRDTLRKWAKLQKSSGLTPAEFQKKTPVIDVTETLPINYGDVAVIETGNFGDAFGNLTSKLVFTN